MSETDQGSSATDDSRAATFLVHLGDGLILGAVPYLTISIVFYLSSGFFARTVRDHPGLVGISVVLMLVVAGRYTAAARWRDAAYGRKIDGWKGKRSLSWVGAIGIVTALVLFGATISLGGWQAISILIIPYFFTVPVLVVGLLIRIIGEHVI